MVVQSVVGGLLLQLVLYSTNVYFFRSELDPPLNLNSIL
jgi:hypothetical protein